ncbi:MAG TPA: PP2C family protein-serine/threonine phosphatase [Massilibacterium sp.]|nr:PP2C family protein-serine/threonine phosphatase [Massilibacterium sp.]
MKQCDLIIDKYKHLLLEYIRVKDEQTLYNAQQFSWKIIEQMVSPEEVVNLHIQVLNEMYPDLPKDIQDSFDFLLEVMIGYGFAYREHQSLRHRQLQLESEIEVASKMQQMLLKTDIPQIKELDIGVKSVPAKKMSGDYYHFVTDENNCVSVAVADIIGKGIPAALCMSMIKYAMDSIPEQRMQPSEILASLNRVVEQNVDPSMFITMMYGLYDPRVHRFYYAGAGHEPGFYYRAKDKKFTDFFAKGLVLGVSRDTKYREYETSIDVGDMVVLLSDGVTECRRGDEFIEREMVVELLEKHIHLSAQEMVDQVFSELERMQNFELKDDFTLIILRRVV